jgi:cytochrome c peroxidase
MIKARNLKYFIKYLTTNYKHLKGYHYKTIIIPRVIMKKWLLGISMLSIVLYACEKPDNSGDDCNDCPADDRITADYNPQAYKLDLPFWLPTPIIPTDNPLTLEGVALGRMLFYDPILSADSTQSCSSCHNPKLAFTDGQATSVGIRGIRGKRSSMSLVNLAFNPNGFFWDGGVPTLEAQALLPIEDHLEMDDTWENVERKLRQHGKYPALFRKAFGIERKRELTRDLVVKAIAQFERTLISGNSKFDRIIWLNDGWLEDDEERGRRLFFFEPSDINHPGCSHCHFEPLYTDNNFHNNGLDAVPTLEAFADLGRGRVTKNRFDNGKFRAPTLRNIALTAPYMHDGRFATLEEVLEQYAAGGHGVENENANIMPFPLSERDRRDLIAFLKTLTDTSFINNPAFSNPFK